MAGQKTLVEQLTPESIHIDALAYLDNELEDPALQKAVVELVQQEMATFRPRDYLKGFPGFEGKFSGNPLLQEEWERVKKGEKLPALDQERFYLHPPADEERRDPEAWKKALSNAKAQLEHQKLRILNLELYQAYAPNAWVQHCKNLEGCQKHFSSQLKAKEEETAQLNWKRKGDQERNRPKIEQLSQEWESLVEKTLQIERANAALEREVKRLKTAREEKAAA